MAFMKDPFTPENRFRWKQQLLNLDGWINSSLHEAGRGLGEFYERLWNWSRRMKAEGIWRAFSETASEAATLGVAGAMVLLAFAVPAFDEIGSDWRTQSDYSVTFLDRYGNPIGKRGILQDDTVQLEDLPDHLVKAVLATEDRRFFSHFGIDIFGTAARRAGECARRRRRAGRLLHHPAARQEPLPVERADAAAQDQGGLSGAVAGGQPLQARNPEALPRPRLYGRRHFRRRRGGGFLLRQEGAGPRPGRIGAARRPVQGAHPLRAAHQPPGGARPRQRGAHQHGPVGLHDGGPGGRRAPPARRRRGALAARLRRLFPRLGVRAGEEPRRRQREGADCAHHARHAPAEGGGGGDRIVAARIGRGDERQPGGAGQHGPGRLDARFGRRARLRRLHLQPRRQRAPPAGLLLQGLCLCDGAGDRKIHARHDRARCARVDRQLVAAKLWPLLQGLAADAQRIGAVAEHCRRAPFHRDRPRADRAACRADGRARRRSGSRARWRSAAPR